MFSSEKRTVNRNGFWITDTLSWRWAFYINFPVGVLSLVLTALFIFDPDYIKKQRAGKIDYVGLGFLIVALGCLQVVLDKGEREDWFSSAFIVRLVDNLPFLAFLHELLSYSNVGKTCLQRSLLQ